MRHMVVAIYGKSSGGGPQAVISSMLIARDQLGKWGYLYHRGGNEVLEGIRLTSKGWLRDRKHLTEGFAGQAKDLEFKRLFEMIKPQLHELDGPSGVKAPKSQPKAGEAGPERTDKGRKDLEFDNKPKPLYPPAK